VKGGNTFGIRSYCGPRAQGSRKQRGVGEKNGETTKSRRSYLSKIRVPKEKCLQKGCKGKSSKVKGASGPKAKELPWPPEKVTGRV